MVRIVVQIKYVIGTVVVGHLTPGKVDTFDLERLAGADRSDTGDVWVPSRVDVGLLLTRFVWVDVDQSGDRLATPRRSELLDEGDVRHGGVGGAGKGGQAEWSRVRVEGVTAGAQIRENGM